MQIQVLNADSSREIDAAFETIMREKPDALLSHAPHSSLNRHVQLVQLAAYHRLPATYSLREFAEIGGLMSYGSNIVDALRQFGVYAGRLLKGAKPSGSASRAIGQVRTGHQHPDRRMLGLTVPQTLLSVADEVIE